MSPQSGSVGLGPLLVLVVILIALTVFSQGLVVFARKRAAPTRHRGRWLVVRIVCAAAGVGLLVAVGLVTRHAAHGIYADRETSAHLQVHVPAEAVDAALAGAADLHEREAKYLVHFIVAEFDAAGVTPLAVKEFQVNWPADRNKSFEATIECSGATVSTLFSAHSIERLQRSPEEADAQPSSDSGSDRLESAAFQWADSGVPDGLALIGVSTVRVSSWSEHYERSHGRTEAAGKAILVARSPRKPLFSAMSKRLADIRAFYLITQADSGDLLTAVSVDELLTRHAPVVESVRRHAVVSRQVPDKMAMAMPWGMGLAYSLGLTTAVLVVAVTLLTLAFPMRSVAAIGMTLIVVLYVVALDRSTLAYHLARMDDKTATVEVRLLGCTQATDTFFFRKTVLKQVEAAAQDENAPPELRSLAEQVGLSLGQ